MKNIFYLCINKIQLTLNMCMRQNKFDIRQNGILRYPFYLLWQGYFSHSGSQDYDLTIDTEEKQIYSTLGFFKQSSEDSPGIVGLEAEWKAKMYFTCP